MDSYRMKDHSEIAKHDLPIFIAHLSNDETIKVRASNAFDAIRQAERMTGSKVVFVEDEK